MSLLRPRNQPAPLSAVYSPAALARLTGLSRGRITQLRSAGGPAALPRPDAEGSSAERPLWRGETVARWCAAAGRRLPARTASWLLPGPDGPQLQHADRRSLQLRQDLGDSRPTQENRRPPIDISVARYTDPSGNGPSVWLATVLTPGESARLLGWPPLWPFGSPLQHLVHELLSEGVPGPFTDGGNDLAGTLVLLPTQSTPEYGTSPGLVRTLDLFRTDFDRLIEAEESLHGLVQRMRQRPVQAREMTDLVTALGHRLPWWPPGCATPALVAAWRPGTPSAEAVPPPLAEAAAFRTRCAATAAHLDGELAASLRELGNSWWVTASSSWQPGTAGSHGALPAACDPAVWEVALRSTLPSEPPAYDGDFGLGLEWLMDHSPSQRLARDARRIFGDPDSDRVVVLDTAALPEAARDHLTSAVTRAEAVPSLRAQSVLDALAEHPTTPGDAALGRWPATTGPAWCATTPGSPMIALHIPRSLPTATGDPLSAVVMYAETPAETYSAPKGVVLVTTDADQLVVLPESGPAEHLAAAIEHTVWHPGHQVLAVGLEPSTNEPLTSAVEALLAAEPQETPWRHLADLVRPEPDGDLDHCPYCRHRARSDA